MFVQEMPFIISTILERRYVPELKKKICPPALKVENRPLP
jgi:hypothetical protein